MDHSKEVLDFKRWMNQIFPDEDAMKMVSEMLIKRDENKEKEKCKGCGHLFIYNREFNCEVGLGLDSYHLVCRFCEGCNKRAFIINDESIYFIDDPKSPALSIMFFGRKKYLPTQLKDESGLSIISPPSQSTQVFHPVDTRGRHFRCDVKYDEITNKDINRLFYAKDENGNEIDVYTS